MIATLPTRVLLVEDNPGDARLLREYLAEARAERFELVQADRMSTAERTLQESAFDVVLLDLSLPDGVGLETVTRMLSVAPTLPIVVLTGTDDETLALRTVQAGAQDYLVKGQLSGQLLERTVRYAIERRKALDAERRHAETTSLARRSRFLVEAGRALAASLDFDTLLKTLGRLVVPSLANLCVLDFVNDDGIRRHVLGWSSTLSEGDARALEEYPPKPTDVANPSIDAMRSGRIILTHVDEPGLRRATRSAEHRGVWERLDATFAMTVPLQARGRIFGTLSALVTGVGEALEPETQSLVEELAQHAALALDNAVLYRRQQSAVRAREDIVNVVSHDLRNPLNVVTMTTAILKRELDGTPRARYVERIERSTEQMLRLINDLLDVAKIESGTLGVETAAVPVDVIIASAVDLLKPLVTSRTLTLSTSVASDLPQVTADRSRILQVLSNLVGNAIKFTPPGGRIELSARLVNDHIRFEVRDTGPGIAAEHVARVFDRFWQGRRNDTAGAGLGLAIAKAIVDAHQGAIGVESELGSGCCFHFVLPVAKPAPVSERAVLLPDRAS